MVATRLYGRIADYAMINVYISVSIEELCPSMTRDRGHLETPADRLLAREDTDTADALEFLLLKSSVIPRIGSKFQLTVPFF